MAQLNVPFPFGWLCSLLSCKLEAIEKLLNEQPEVFWQILAVFLAGIVLFKFWKHAKTQLDMENFLLSASYLMLFNFGYMLMQIYIWAILLKAFQSEDKDGGVIIASALLLVLFFVWLELAFRPNIGKTEFNENPPIVRVWVYLSRLLPNFFKVPKKGSFVNSAVLLVKLFSSIFTLILIYQAWTVLKVLNELLVFPLLVTIAGIVWLCYCPFISRIYYFLVLIWAWIFVYLLSGSITSTLAYILIALSTKIS